MARSKMIKSALVLATSLALWACAGDDTPIALPGGSNSGNPSSTPQVPSVSGYKYLIVAGDENGNINFFGDDGDMMVMPLADPSDAGHDYVLSPQNSAEEKYAFGETHIVETEAGDHFALMLVKRHVLNDAGVEVGGGVAVIDLERMALAGIIPLPSAMTGKMSVPTHATLAPDGGSLWINNDGPSDDPATPAREDAGPDSVFILHVADLSVMTDAAGDLMLDHFEAPEEFLAGDGAKLAAFAHHVDGNPEAHSWYVATNATDQTITVADYSDIENVAVIETLNSNAHLAPVAKRNAPAGAAFSPVSGKVYVGVSSGVDVAVATIDATVDAGAVPMLDVTTFKVGNAAAKKIPAAGFVTTSHDGAFVFTVGYVPGTAAAPDSGVGYLSIIDAHTDTVTDVVELGNLYANNIVVHEDETTMELKVFIPGADMMMADPLDPAIQIEVPGILNDHLAVVTVDHETGVAMTHADNMRVEYIDVPKGAAQRAGQITMMGEHLIIPAGNAAECAVDHHPHNLAEVASNDCQTLTVIHVADNEVIEHVQMMGHAPGGFGVWEIVMPTSAPPAGSSGGGSSGGHGHM